MEQGIFSARAFCISWYLLIINLKLSKPNQLLISSYKERIYMGLQQCPHVKYFGTNNRKCRLRKMFLVKFNTMLPCLPSHVFNAAWSSKDSIATAFKDENKVWPDRLKTILIQRRVLWVWMPLLLNCLVPVLGQWLIHPPTLNLNNNENK